MKKYVLAVLFAVILQAGNLFAITGELIVRSVNGTQPKLRITVNTSSYAWKWNGTTQQVNPETRTFPVVHEGYSYNFDAPKSIDSNTDYLPWGLMNFTVSTLDANNNVVTTINFTMDLRDEDWSTVTSKYPSHDTYIERDVTLGKWYINGGGKRSELKEGDLVRIWIFWNYDGDPNSTNLKVPITLMNRTEGGNYDFGYLVANGSEQVNSGQNGNFRYNLQSTVSHGTTEETSSGKKYSFNWTNVSVDRVSNQNIYNSTLNFTIPENKDSKSITRWFKTVFPLYVKNNLEEVISSADTIFFKDPTTTNILEKKTASGSSGFTKNEAFAYLDETINYIPHQKYALKAKNTITYGGKVYQWYRGDFNPDAQSDFIVTGTTTKTAYYKGISVSNSAGAFTNNGQKKLVDIYGGGTYRVYESMNRVWMENSTNNGSTWTLTYNNPISGTATANNPSIDIPDGPYAYEYIVYNTSDPVNGSKVTLTTTFDNLFRSTIDVSSYLSTTNYDFQPVIAIKQNETNSKIIVVWHQPYVDYYNPAGLYYRIGTINLDHTVTWNDYPRYMAYTENCSNPTIVASKTLTDPNQFHLAYQEDMGGGDSRVSYLRLDLNSDNTISYSNGYEVSEGSGYYVNTNPTITLSGGLPKVGWIGYDRVMTYMQDALFRSKTGSVTWDDVYSYGTSGNNAVTVSLDRVGQSGFILGYGDDVGDIRYVKSTDLSTERYADNTGSYVQVKGGPDFNSSYIVSFNNGSLPYYFTSSNTISTLGKTNTETIAGRGITLTKGGLGYSFNLKDVRLEGNQIDFAEKSDSAIAQKNSIETKAFSVGDNSELTYSYSYFTSDSAKVLVSLKDGEVVKYSLDLVDATSKEVLKTLASVSYSNKDAKNMKPGYYKLLLKGVGNRTVKLRISADVDLTDASGVVSTIAKIYSTSSSLKKNSFIEVNYSDVKPVTEYGLSQNYPNPFNPSTIINFQIPEASKVMLKVYDMLGKEVATLVDGYKEMGSYSVQFNASELPSGTYIYEIRANNFVKSGKMLLLK